MYCSECSCEFEGWTGNCPNCKTPLVERLPSIAEAADEPISYEALVDLVGKNGGSLRIDLSASEVGREKRRGFPYSGYGYAWTKRMRGVSNNILVDLATTGVGKAKKERFPYRGFGMAWAKAMQGSVAGNQVALTAKRVGTDRKWSFPYSGYGYAWAQEMSGQCGDELTVDLRTTDVGRRRRSGFPYLGYGLAWARWQDRQLARSVPGVTVGLASL